MRAPIAMVADTASSPCTATSIAENIAVASSAAMHTIDAPAEATAIDAASPAAVVTAVTTATARASTSATTRTLIPGAPLAVASSTVATSSAVQNNVAAAQASGECGKVEPMSELLDSASALVEKMEEAKFMCRHVLKRIKEIYDRDPPIEGNDAATLLKITREFVAFLDEFANEPICVYRLVHCRIIMARVRSFHNDLDNLGKPSQDASEPMNGWESDFAACRKVMQGKFAERSHDKRTLCSVEQTTAEQQCKVLALIMYEIQHFRAAYSEGELKVLTDAHSALSRFSEKTMRTVERWFLPKYEIQIESEKYSSGSFAEVYLAKLLGERVVVKIPIPREGVFDIGAFAKEADVWFLASKIPQVVRLHGANHFDDKPYFVSEFAANGTLICFVKTHEKGPSMVWKLLLEAAYGLKGIHQLGIVHNDLKCNNILVTGDFKAKLTDFGLSSFTAANIAEGAYRWKSPEVFKGSDAYKRAQEAVAKKIVTASALAQASDVYSFGMCIWEAVTQGQPWGAMKDVAVKDNLANGKLPDTVKGFSAEQWALVKNMCVVEPTKRISIDSAIGRLKKFADDERNVQHALKRVATPSPAAATARARESVVAEPAPEPVTATVIDTAAVRIETMKITRSRCEQEVVSGHSTPLTQPESATSSTVSTAVCPRDALFPAHSHAFSSPVACWRAASVVWQMA